MYSTSVLSLELSIQYASFKYYAKNMAMGLGASNAMFCYMTSLCKAINIIFHCFAIVLNFPSSIKLFSPSLSLSLSFYFIGFGTKTLLSYFLYRRIYYIENTQRITN